MATDKFDDAVATRKEFREAMNNAPVHPSDPNPVRVLMESHRAVARMLIRRADASHNNAVKEALRMAAADVAERTPGMTLENMESFQ